MARVVVPRSAKQVSLFSVLRRAPAACDRCSAAGHPIPPGGSSRMDSHGRDSCPAGRLLREWLPAAEGANEPGSRQPPGGDRRGACRGPSVARRHPVAWSLAGAEALGWLAYTRWYSWFGRTPSPALAIGQMLPADLPFVEHDRGPVTWADLRGKAECCCSIAAIGARCAWRKSATSPRAGGRSRQRGSGRPRQPPRRGPHALPGLPARRRVPVSARRRARGIAPPRHRRPQRHSRRHDRLRRRHRPPHPGRDRRRRPHRVRRPDRQLPGSPDPETVLAALDGKPFRSNGTNDSSAVTGA